MAGNKKQGRATAKTLKEKYGEDFYVNMGRRGGSKPTNKLKGFAANRELARQAGAKGGANSRKNKNEN